MEVFMIDMEEFAAMNRIYAKRFEGIEHPARFAVEVSRLPANARVEIAAIAAFE
jgi:2-iminobutanoate/2-iminopropanoate deaminase